MTSSLKLFLILYYTKQIDSKLPCICSVIDHRWRQNVVRTSVTHSAAPRVPLFCSYHILTSSVIYYWTDARQLGIYLLNRILHEFITECFNVFWEDDWQIENDYLTTREKQRKRKKKMKRTRPSIKKEI